MPQRGALTGLRVATTRPPLPGGAPDPLARKLREAGATVTELPLTHIEAGDAGPLLEALREERGWDWVCFTSATTVRRVLGDEADPRVKEGFDRVLQRAHVASVGSATSEELEVHGVSVTLVPSRYTQEGMLEEFRARAREMNGARLLLPTASDARPVLASGLRDLGVEVAEIAVYRSVADAANAARLASLVSAREVDVIAVMAPSAVEALRTATIQMSVSVASIGPVTSQAARTAGLEVAVEAEPSTVEGLVQELVMWRRLGGR